VLSSLRFHLSYIRGGYSSSFSLPFMVGSSVKIFSLPCAVPAQCFSVLYSVILDKSTVQMKVNAWFEISEIIFLMLYFEPRTPHVMLELLKIHILLAV